MKHEKEKSLQGIENRKYILKYDEVLIDSYDSEYPGNAKNRHQHRHRFGADTEKDTMLYFGVMVWVHFN